MRPLRPIFLASFFFSVHVALLSYLNSTVLALHTSGLQITLAYTLSSALSLVFLIGAGNIVRKTGSSKFLVGTLVLCMLLLLALGTIAAHTWFVLVFILYFSLNTVIWYGFDLVIEHYSREAVTGNIRGIYLTLNNAGWVMAPMAASLIATTIGFSGTYIAAALAVCFSAILIKTTAKIPLPTHLPKISFSDSFRAINAHLHARRIVVLYFSIQFFFAWMVLYMIPYLTSLGFGLGMIGIILSVMLLPFVLFQYGVGKIADRFHNERTIITIGFGITAGATMLLALPFAPHAAIFAGILFLTRVGASFIEVGCESSFFKEVTEKDTALISTLRMTLPLAYIIAPLLGAIILWLGSMQILFITLSILMFGAMFYALRLKN
ncbi:MAG: MFS transporter [Candidatus Pacebacteria bacterium]|nr:MFS transporter [Candidatus Paceibacterota bacterium]